MIYGLYTILIILILISFVKNKKNINPQKVFNLIFLFIIILYQFKLSYLQQNLSDRTILLFVLAILSFNIGCIIMTKIKIKELKQIINYKTSSEQRIKIANYIFVILFIIECIYTGGFPLLFQILYGKSHYMNFGIPSLHGALNGLAICLGSYFIIKKDKRRFIY